MQEKPMSLTALLKKRTFLYIPLTMMNIACFVFPAILFSGRMYGVSFFVLSIPIFLSFLFLPVLLLVSLVYAIVRIRKFPLSTIPIITYILIAAVIINGAPMLMKYDDDLRRSYLHSDALDVVNMVKAGELVSEEYGKEGYAYLPREYKHVSVDGEVYIGFRNHEHLYVFFNDSTNFLSPLRGYIYSEYDILAGGEPYDLFFNADFVVPMSDPALEHWYYAAQEDE